MPDQDEDFEEGMIAGKFGEQIKTLFKQNQSANQKLDKIIESMNGINMRAVRAHDRLDNLIGPDGPIVLTGKQGVITELKAGQADYARNKLKAAAILGAIATTGGAFGTKVAEKVSKISAVLGF